MLPAPALLCLASILLLQSKIRQDSCVLFFAIVLTLVCVVYYKSRIMTCGP